jgi:hypothetical protein
MKLSNIKTTLAGALGGLLLASQPVLEAYKSGAFDGKTGTQLAAAIALVVLGYLSSDASKTEATK